MLPMKEIKFKPLPNSVPEGTQMGDSFDLVCTFRLEENGEVCLEQMGDVKAEYKEDKKSMVRPGMEDEIKAMQSSMMADSTSGQSATGSNY